MPDEKRSPPTDAEVEILSVLWERGPSTVREVFTTIAKRRPEIGYTTVLKLMQIMAAKGHVKRDERTRTHIYRPAADERQTQRRLLRDLLAKAFGGSKEKLLLSALDATRATPAELEAMKKLLDIAKSSRDSST
jgi:BlaI family transcriptional regulator, penicillinase repressor